MTEAAVNVVNFSPVRKEELAKIQRRFSYSTDGTKHYYTTKKGIMVDIRHVNIHCLENIQVDIELAGGRDGKLWQLLEDEITRRKLELTR